VKFQGIFIENSPKKEIKKVVESPFALAYSSDEDVGVTKKVSTPDKKPEISQKSLSWTVDVPIVKPFLITKVKKGGENSFLSFFSESHAYITSNWFE
jgi:hypothetical protein